MDAKLLLVEDNARVATSLVQGLREESYEIRHVGNAADAIKAVTSDRPDLTILDLGLPDRDGLEVLAEIRKLPEYVPVVLLTARDSVNDRVTGLDLGADDYVPKPFSFPELLARIRTQLRRAEQSSPVIQVADLTIDVLNRAVTRGGRAIELTSKEFDLLKYLAQNAGQNVSREMLARDVWNVTSRATPLDNVIDVHMSHLREKVDKEFDTKLIQTVRGVGFVLKGE